MASFYGGIGAVVAYYQENTLLYGYDHCRHYVYALLYAALTAPLSSSVYDGSNMVWHRRVTYYTIANIGCCLPRHIRHTG